MGHAVRGQPRHDDSLLWQLTKVEKQRFLWRGTSFTVPITICGFEGPTVGCGDVILHFEQDNIRFEIRVPVRTIEVTEITRWPEYAGPEKCLSV